MSKQTKRAAASAIGVQNVPTASLHPNPHNPRMLFDRQPLKVLRQSIERVGILVPLTVYLEARRKRLVILDGQRRWMCAQEIGLEEVPVNQVAEPSLVENIVTMFQIHKFRADWELMPTALKVDLLMKEVGDRNNARLAELTGLDEAVITRCKKLISYDKEFQDLMLDPDPDKRIKADFFIELYPVIHDREISHFEWFSKNKFIRRMLEKYLRAPRTIRSVTDFRLVKQHIANARRVGAVDEFSRRLREFFEVHESPLSHLEIEEANIHAGANAIVKKISSLEASIVDLDAEQFYGEEALWESIISLIKVLEKKLLEANKRH